MTDSKRIKVSDIDFNDIRENLVNFLNSQEEFQDYNFEGSGLATIINLLSYVTHYNAINANIGLNESFIDTAQFRGSVVNRAKELGYIPNSAVAPAAFINITIPEVEPGETVVIPRGHRFKTTIDGKTYTFVTTDEYRTTTNVIENVRIIQGIYQTSEFLFDIRSSEKNIIPDKNVDTSTLIVNVFDSEETDSFESFVQAKQLPSITKNSNIYFLSETPDEYFEIGFGDGIIGRKITDGNIIKVEYVVTKKEEANGARIFNLVDPIPNKTGVTIQTISPAKGGKERESIDSIKLNAPITFASQNRAVTISDYEAVIRENFTNVQSIRAWGGEDNIPPVYGKVFVSIVPKDTDLLSTLEKERILNDILIPKSVASITPEIIDPEFLFVTAEVFFRYDQSKTNLTRTQLESKVLEQIQSFADKELNRFDSMFRYSRFLDAIDNTDASILNSFARIFLQKRFVPNLDRKQVYTLDFSLPFIDEGRNVPIINDSSEFTIRGVSGCRFKDFLIGDERIISAVKGTGEFERVIQKRVGFVENNKIILDNFTPDDFVGLTIMIEVIPNAYDVTSSRNVVIGFDCDCRRFKISGQVDNIVDKKVIPKL